MTSMATCYQDSRGLADNFEDYALKEEGEYIEYNLLMKVIMLILSRQQYLISSGRTLVAFAKFDAITKPI